MRVIQCDRCNKTYTKNSNTQRYIVQQGFSHYTYDLCDDCIIELNKTLDKFFE